MKPRRYRRPRLRFNKPFPPWARTRLECVGLREFFTAPFYAITVASYPPRPVNVGA